MQVISRRVVGRAEETSTYSWSRFCTVNCRPMASNYQLSHLRPCWEPNPSLRGGRRECYTLPPWPPEFLRRKNVKKDNKKLLFVVTYMAAAFTVNIIELRCGFQV